jgi:nucleoside-diphosphate-sugar epimerase
MRHKILDRSIEKESITYNILVTGGAGFIGSHIVEELLKKEVFFSLYHKSASVRFEIFILDNFSTGKMENIEHLLKHNNVHLIEYDDGRHADLTNYHVLLWKMKDMDYIIHQGALGSVPRSFDEPKLYAQHNIIATMNIFNIADIYKDKIKGIVQASSSSVYGDTKELPKHEQMDVTPKSPYAFSKLVCEEMAHNFNLRTRIPVTSLRYFNVFGSRQNLNGIYSPVIPNFINAINNNEPCIIHGDGTQTRDFTYVKYVAEVNINRMINDLYVSWCIKSTSGNTGSRILNVGFGENRSINDIFKDLGGTKKTHTETRQGDVKDTLACVDRIERLEGCNYTGLDYNYVHYSKDNFKEYLEETVRFYKNENY